MRTYEIHGNLETVRCSRECTKAIYPFPADIVIESVEQEITSAQLNQLKCPNCGSMLRPNILWFDELYNERLYKLDSSLKAAKNTGLLFIIGTSGATNLPNQLVAQTLHYGGSIVDINIEEGHFALLAREKKNGYVIRGTSSEVLPQLVSQVRQVALI